MEETGMSYRTGIRQKKNENDLYRIASAAVEAMLYEVCAAPKPGLVDRFGRGAHHDMDVFTFLSGAASLHGCFDEMARIGFEWRFAPVRNMWPSLREAGISAEQEMFSGTAGVNTQKGEIFSLGILCACAAREAGLKGTGPDQKIGAREVCAHAAALCEGLCGAELEQIRKEGPQTEGQRAFLEHGCRGIRGEAESGYQTVLTVSLPVYRQLLAEGHPANDALVQTLLYLAANADDSNVVARCGPATADRVRRRAAQAISLGGMFTEAGQQDIRRMDEEFISGNISPGGCADLLAVTHFLYRLENGTAAPV